MLVIVWLISSADAEISEVCIAWSLATLATPRALTLTTLTVLTTWFTDVRMLLIMSLSDTDIWFIFRASAPNSSRPTRETFAVRSPLASFPTPSVIRARLRRMFRETAHDVAKMKTRTPSVISTYLATIPRKTF